MKPDNDHTLRSCTRMILNCTKKNAFVFLKVGTVEKFQGKEFNAVLVSTVRSNPKLTVRKQQFTLGFVNNEKVRNA